MTATHALSFDSAVAGLERAGVSHDAAVRHVRKHMPDLARQHDADSDDRADVLEKAEQREVVKIYRAFAFDVYTTSQSRASRVSVGIPDVYAISERHHVAIWHEVKRSIGGRLSEPQKRFQALCAAAGVHHVVGDRDDARIKLISLGLARMINGVLEPIR